MLLDTASLYFRAYFGVPDSIKAPDGTPVNAVRGLLDFISRLVEEYRPTHLACCWDNDWRPQWRVPDPLEAQIPVIVAVLEAFGIAIVGADGYEADDVIGTLATKAGMPVEIVTGDRDLFQLVDDSAEVRVLYTARGVGRHERVTEDVVREKYGIEAHQYADFATLRGDNSDGLPGVAGVGEKTAATLLGRFGSVSALREAALDPDADLAPGPRRKILDAADYLEVAPTVVAVARDLDLNGPDLRLPRTPVDPEAIKELAGRWGLSSPIARLVETLTDLG